jgi:hypothetical protein
MLPDLASWNKMEIKVRAYNFKKYIALKIL